MSLRAGRTSEWRRDSGPYPQGEEPYGAMKIEMEKIERWRKKWAAIFGKALNTGVKGAQVKGESTCQKNSVPPYGHGERNKENWNLEI